MNSEIQTEQHLNMYRREEEQDSVCQQVTEYCWTSWSTKGLAKPDIAPYWKVWGSLTLCNQLSLYGYWIVIPKSLQEETKQKSMLVLKEYRDAEQELPHLYSSWERVSKLLKQCNSVLSVQRIPLLTRNHWWYCNCWSIHGRYLGLICLKSMELTIFSQWTISRNTLSTMSAAMIKALKSVFYWHGILSEVILVLNIHHRNLHSLQVCMSSTTYITCSSRFPWSNGQVERTVKRLLRRSRDPYLALLGYRATPLPWCDLHPA